MKEVFRFHNNKKYQRSTLLFFFAYTIWVVYALLRYTYIGKILSLSHYKTEIKLVVCIILALKFLDDESYRIQSFIGLSIVLLIGVIEYSVQDKTVSLFILAIFVFSTKCVSFEDILKVTLFIDVFILVITVFLSLNGIIPNNVWDEGIRQRYDLGFTYCTFSSHLMLFITMVYCCVRRKIHFAEMIILATINIGLFMYTNTRLDLCIVLPFLIMVYVWTSCSSTVCCNLFTKLLFQYSNLILAIISIATQYFYRADHYFFSMLNDLLSNRLYLGNVAITTYGFRLFGQKIKWVGQGSLKKNPFLTYNYVDCSFLKYLLNYGIVFSILLSIALIYIGKKAIDEKNQALCVSILFLAVFAMIDAELCVLAFHPFLLKAGELINPTLGGEDEIQSNKNYTYQ